jgi:hypothetical protein
MAYYSKLEISKMSNNCVIDLKSRKDGNGRVFYVGKLKAPMFIDCRKGVTFLIFTAEKDCEELQIAMTEDKKEFDE